MTKPVNSQLPTPNAQHNFSHRFLVGLGVGSWTLGVCVCALLVAPAHAQQMPDPSQIHGKAIPATELQAGTVEAFLGTKVQQYTCDPLVGTCFGYTCAGAGC